VTALHYFGGTCWAIWLRWKRQVVLFPDEVRLGCGEVFFCSLFSFSFPWNSCQPFQKTIMSSGFYFSFDAFLSLVFFFSNSSLSILFHLIFLSNLVPLLLIALFLCFILFLIIIVLQFCPLTFYCIHFLIQFWSSFFWLLYSYLFLNSSSFFFYFFLQHLISFDVLSNFGPHSLDNCFYPFRSLFFFQFNP
jgi:hypothetical protein